MAHNQPSRLWEKIEGSPLPLGVSWIETVQVFNFAVHAEHAESVALLLFSANDLIDPVATIRFDYLRDKSGRMWHSRIAASEVGQACCYVHSHDSHSAALCLHGASHEGDDIYVTTNACWEPVTFDLEEGMPYAWKRIVNTALSSPQDLVESGVAVEGKSYEVATSSIVVLLRPRPYAQDSKLGSI